MNNFDNLRACVEDARGAIGKVMPPLPKDDANAYAALYYPLLFMTEAVDKTLRHVLKAAHEGMREENRAAAEWLAALESSKSSNSAAQERVP